MAVLVTGVAGFIGSATARALLERGDGVVGIDNLNDYYDPAQSETRQKSWQNSCRYLSSWG
jgi:UDP-glucuronate 4-epimerase